MNKSSLLVILLLSYLSCCGQFNLSGNVISSETDKELLDIDVYLLEEDLVQKSNFNFENLESKEYTLIIFGIGYNTLEMRFKLERDTTITIHLSPLATELTEVVIQDQKDEISTIRAMRAVEGTAIYSGKKSEVIRIDRIQGNLGANNSRQIYAQIAGLNIFEGNDGGLQLAIGGRGLDPNRTSNFNTRQNGYDISADVLGYPESYYTPPAEALDEIQIIRGAASLQYGSQFGGLINFKTHSIPRSKKFEFISKQTIGSFGFFNSFNSIGINKGRWTVNGYFNFKEGNGYRLNSDFNSRNFFLNAKYRISRKTSIKVEANIFNYLAQQAGGLTDKKFAENPRQSNRARNWFQVNWKSYHVLLKHKFSSKSQMTINAFALDASRNAVGFRGNPYDLNQNPISAIDERISEDEFLSPRDLIEGNFNNFGTEVRFLHRYKIKDKTAIWLIGSKYYQAKNTANQGPGSTGIDPNFEDQSQQFPDYPNQSKFKFPNKNLAFFTEHIFYFTKNLAITPGLRFEHINTQAIGNYNVVQFDIAGNPINNTSFSEKQSLSRTFFLAGIGLSFKPSKYLNTYANISQNYRSVTFSDIRTVNPTFIIDPGIRDERGFTSDIGIRGILKDKISYDIGLYNIVYNNRIGIILNERANRVRKNIGNAIIYGLESLLEVNFLGDKKERQFRWFINTAITDSRYTSSDENSVIGNRVEFIPRLNLRSGFRFAFKNFSSSLQFSFLSSQFTDVQNTLARESGDSRNGIIGKIPSYSVLDWSIGYRLKYFSISSGVNNILNKSYFTRRASGYPGPGIIPSDGRNFYLTIGFKI